MSSRTLLTVTLMTFLSACSAECTAGGSDDGSGGDGATSSSTSASVGTDTGTGGAGTGGDAASGTGGDATGGTGGDATGGTGGDATGGTGGATGSGGGGTDEGGYCALACDVPADCCPAGAQGCPGDYPYNYECIDNLCANPGCSEDEQCQFGGTQPDYGCFSIEAGSSTYGLCSESCDNDDDCETDGWVCIGESVDGTYCQPEPVDPIPCDDDNDCRGFGVCQDDGTCRCGDDDECTEDGYVCVE